MNNPRRIIAAAGPDGRSCVVSNEAIALSNPQPMNVINLWNGAAGRVDNAAAFAGGFAPFGMHQLTDPIYSVMIAEYAPGLGKDDPGMHYTDTADHFFVIEGEVVLVLEVMKTMLLSKSLKKTWKRKNIQVIFLKILLNKVKQKVEKNLYGKMQKEIVHNTCMTSQRLTVQKLQFLERCLKERTRIISLL